ncbi:unnamed protein product [Cylicocyclus nassatus]|uniref:Uncharacterized protein n=1 Tax=Cylicocyclus nassatus TaxID=53992 RepID=A0AA36HFL6_CYLNA|nr:unnamed protein product [Cylicocyclus nassatus]
MRFLLFLFILLFAICHSLPPFKAYETKLKREWIRRTRSSPQEETESRRVVTLFGHKVTVPSFLQKMCTSIKEFFVGRSGVITKIQEFLKGNKKFSINILGRKVDFKAHVPSSAKDADKSFRKLLRKFRTDPMARVLLVIYLNLVVIIIVYLALIAKHVQFSLQSMKKPRKEKSPTTPGGHYRTTVSPDTNMPAVTLSCQRSPDSQGTMPEQSTQDTSDESKTIDWSAVTNPSLMNVLDQETIVTTHDPPRLLTDLQGLLSNSDEAVDHPPDSTNSVSVTFTENASTVGKSPSNDSRQSLQQPTTSTSYFTALDTSRSSRSSLGTMHSDPSVPRATEDL